MALIDFYIRNQKLSKNGPEIIADTIKYVDCSFTFKTSDWDGTDKWLLLEKGGTAHEVNLVDDAIPKECGLSIGAGIWHASLFGIRSDGTRITTDSVTLEVKESSIPEGGPLPVIEQTASEQIAARAQDAFAKANEALETANSVKEAAENGEFNGKDGYTPVIELEQTYEVATDRSGVLIKVYHEDGSISFAGLSDGERGNPGYSPIVAVSEIEGGHRVLVRHTGGSEEFDVMDGTDGTNGKDGTSIRVTSISGSSASGGTNRVEFSDGSAVNIKNGIDGKDGSDYVLTDSDKAEIAELAKGTSPVPSYWETAIANAISKVKALQDMGGKDLVNFVHFSDMHYNSDRTNYTDNLGAVAARLMMELDIPLMVGTGDITESGTASSSAMIDADVEQALETLEPVGLENLLYCKGNHDGAWGAKADYGVNYAMIQHPDKLWNRLYRWQAEDFRRVFSEDGSYYYIDNIPQKVRYIVLNAHWADYSNITDLDYDAQATEYNTQKNINYGDEQAEWLAKTALDFADKKGWTVVVFTHPPLWNKHNGVIKSYMNVQYAGTNNASTIRSILMGFYNKESAVAYKSGSTIDYSGIDESNTVAGVFTGHCHTDIATKYDESGTGTNIPFPIISVTSAGNANSSYEEGFGYPVTTRTNGTDTETAFDIVCINKKTKTINTVRVGAGSDRSITYSEEEDVPVTLLSISAVYSGGSVEVGTSINSLTGITVTAHYSDGSTENVTGYTLSGSISNAGNNTITVSYGGKTATFTVEGIGIEEETTVPIVWKNGYKCTYAVGSACTVSADASYIITEEIPVSYGKTYSFTGGPAGANGTLKFVGVDSSDKVTEAKDFNIVSGKTASFSWTPTNASTAGLRLRSYSNAIGDIKNSTVMDIS